MHSSDGWAVADHKWSIKQHEKLSERKTAAYELEEEYANIQSQLKITSEIDESILLPILIDDMENMANFCFGALPERLAILYQNKLVFLGGMGPFDYSIKLCESALVDILSKLTNKK